jgi:hypothetical protein
MSFHLMCLDVSNANTPVTVLTKSTTTTKTLHRKLFKTHFHSLRLCLCLWLGYLYSSTQSFKNTLIHSLLSPAWPTQCASPVGCLSILSAQRASSYPITSQFRQALWTICLGGALLTKSLTLRIFMNISNFSSTRMSFWEQEDKYWQ